MFVIVPRSLFTGAARQATRALKADHLKPHELEEDKEVPASFLSRFHCSATVSARDNIYRGRLKSMFQVA